MDTVGSLAAEVALWFSDDHDYDWALEFVISTAEGSGVELGDQPERVASVGLDRATAQDIWEDAAIAAETALY